MQIRQGIAVSPGVAIAPAFVLDADDRTVARETVPAAQVAAELERLQAALASSRGEIAKQMETTASTLGEYPFPTEKPKDQSSPFGQVVKAAVHVSPDGLSVWVLDPVKNVAVQFAIEGEKKDD